MEPAEGIECVTAASIAFDKLRQYRLATVTLVFAIVCARHSQQSREIGCMVATDGFRDTRQDVLNLEGFGAELG